MHRTNSRNSPQYASYIPHFIKIQWATCKMKHAGRQVSRHDISIMHFMRRTRQNEKKFFLEFIFIPRTNILIFLTVLFHKFCILKFVYFYYFWTEYNICIRLQDSVMLWQLYYYFLDTSIHNKYLYFTGIQGGYMFQDYYPFLRPLHFLHLHCNVTVVIVVSSLFFKAYGCCFGT